MTAITIPKTIDEATERLNGLGALLTAKEWERAAIVYAFTRDSTRGERTDMAMRGQVPMTTRQFERLGVTGLRSHMTVGAYRKAWQKAILDGHATPVDPGEKVELPALDWAEYVGGTMTGTPHSAVENVRAAIRRDPEAISKAVADDPDVFEAVADQVAAEPALAGRVQRKVEQRHREAITHPTPEREPIPARVAAAVLNDILTFWDGTVGGVGSREEVVRLVAANRNALSLVGMAVNRPLPDQIADALRRMAEQATTLADAIEASAAVEVTQ